MARAKKIPVKKVVKKVPQTRGERDEAKKHSSVLGYLKLPKGRPPNEKKMNKGSKKKSHRMAETKHLQKTQTKHHL